MSCPKDVCSCQPVPPCQKEPKCDSCQAVIDLPNGQKGLVVGCDEEGHLKVKVCK